MTRDERQEQCRVKWIKNKCRATIVATTGFGKTRVAVNCIRTVLSRYPEFKILIVVPTTALKEQWESILDFNGFGLNCEVCVVNTAVKSKKRVDFLIIDEIHRLGAPTFEKIFETVSYRIILGLTATFERLDGKHEIINSYCPVVDEITTKEALLNNWVSTYKEYQVLIDVDNLEEYNKYNSEFQQHFEFFNFQFNTAMACLGSNGWKVRQQLRDNMIAPNASPEDKSKLLKTITYHATGFSRALQKRKAFINNHPKKIELAKKIIAARPNSKIITFSNNVKMAESIGIGEVYTGKISKKRSSTVLEDFNEGKFKVINSCSKLDEGVDVKGLSVAIILGINSSKIKSTQRKGRVIRLEEGKNAEIFNLIINDTAETSWFKNSHAGSDYLTIDEHGLEQVLNHQVPNLYNRKPKDLAFRF